MDDRPWFASYPAGVPHTLAPYLRTTLYDGLTSAAERFPTAPAISYLGRHIRYRDLVTLVDRFSAVLASLGVRAGERVALVLPNCPQYVIAYYATLRLGAVVVGNNPLYTDRELAHQLADARPTVCVALDSFYPKLARIRDEVGLRQLIVTKVTDFAPLPVRWLAPIRFRKEARAHGEPWPAVPADAPVRWWGRAVREAGPTPPAASPGPDDLAGLIYTGGTTGLAKGAMLSHRNLVANVLQARAWFVDAVDGRESILCVIPFFHAYGMTVGMNFGIHVGAKLVLVPRFDVDGVLRLIDKEHVTMLPGVPRIYIAINERASTSRSDLHSIRACLSGAAPLPDAVAEKFEAITGGLLVEGYGLTETSPITHANPLDGVRRSGTIGLPVPDTDCRLVDVENATAPVPAGGSGELMVSGPQVMLGYWNHPDETEAAIKTDADGTRWFLTGDVATVDEAGYFRIVDRKKEMIDVSGFKVFPSDVEEVLYRHPKVMKAAVVGVPDPKTGEAVKAFVVLHPGEHATADEILEFCRDPKNGLAGFRVPTSVEFRDSLPETLVGKVLRRELREESVAHSARPFGGPAGATAS